MQNLRNLKVWHLAKLLFADVVRALPSAACRGHSKLRSQTLDAAESISAIIAEGAGRGGQNEFRHYLDMSLGSVFEVETHLDNALEVGILSVRAYRQLTSRAIVLRRMIVSLREQVMDQAPEDNPISVQKRPILKRPNPKRSSSKGPNPKRPSPKRPNPKRPSPKRPSPKRPSP